MALIDFLIAPFTYPFMVRALLAVLVAGVVCALLSCWLVLMGWSLLGDAVSHAVLPGVVISYAIGAPFAVGAAAFGFLAVGLIGIVRETTRLKEDAVIGVVFTTLFAFGLVLVSVTPSQVDLSHIVFGNVLGVSPGDLLQIVILGTLVAIVLVVKRRDFTLYAFDRAHMHAIGGNPRVIGAVMLALLALTCVVALQTVGVVLVVAMLIIPGATAQLLTSVFSRMLLVAMGVALCSALVGLYASFYLDTATGGMVIVAQGLMFVLSWVFAPRTGLIARRATRQA